MKKQIILLYIIGIITLIVLVSCQDDISNKYIAKPGNPKLSPSKKYLLKIIESTEGGINCEKFQILQVQTAKVVFNSKECFRTRDTLFFLWDDNKDIVWLYSGDVGTFYWINISGKWIKNSYTKKPIKTPQFLKLISPQQHKI